MLKRILTCAKALTLVLMTSRSIWAGNNFINVQGKLTNNAGTPLSGTYIVTFRLYGNIADSTATWTESQSVAVSTGLFNVTLGTSTSLNNLVFNTPYYLGIQVAGDSNELSPRQSLGASAYAMGSLGNFSVSNNLVVGSSITVPIITVSTLTSVSSATVSNLSVSNLSGLSNLSLSTITVVSSATISNLSVTSLTVPTINGSWPNPNILINGGFEFWQRGFVFNAPAVNSYVADRWKVDTDQSSGIFVSTTATKDNGNYALLLVVTGSPSNKYWRLDQKIENYTDYAGKTVSASVRAKCSVANVCRIVLYDGSSDTRSAYHTGSGNWETLTVTKTLSASPTRLDVYVGAYATADLQNGTYYFDSTMFVAGNQPVVYVPKDYETELAQCQRYFYKWGGNAATDLLATGQCGGTNVAYWIVNHPVEMRTAPTVTYIGSGFQVWSANTNYISASMATSVITKRTLFGNSGTAGSLVAGNATLVFGLLTSYITLDAEM